MLISVYKTTMSKFLEAVRKIFSKKSGDKKGKQPEESSEPVDPEKWKVQPKQHPYDDVQVGADGTTNIGGGEQPESNTGVTSNNVQDPPAKAPRQYDEVDLPTNGGKVEVKS